MLLTSGWDCSCPPTSISGRRKEPAKKCWACRERGGDETRRPETDERKFFDN